MTVTIMAKGPIRVFVVNYNVAFNVWNLLLQSYYHALHINRGGRQTSDLICCRHDFGRQNKAYKSLCVRSLSMWHFSSWMENGQKCQQHSKNCVLCQLPTKSHTRKCKCEQICMTIVWRDKNLASKNASAHSRHVICGNVPCTLRPLFKCYILSNYKAFFVYIMIFFSPRERQSHSKLS